MVTLRLPDPQRQFARVALDAGPYGGECRYRAGGWQRSFDPAKVWRLEYQFAVGEGRRKRYVPDPDEPRTIETPFGVRSVWERDDYRAPTWLDEPAVPGRLEAVVLPSVLSAPLPVEVWIPRGLRRRDESPLLWVNDGTDYRTRARLSTWAGVQIADGALPPFRIVYADPVRRMQWYSGSDRYLRTMSGAVTAVGERYALSPHLAVAGASLGGLTAMLMAQRDRRIGAVFSQSGSFFGSHAADADNRSWAWFARVERLVRGIAERPPAQRPLIGMTCGLAEGNYENNKKLAGQLQTAGLDVRFAGHPDLHNWTSWRDSLDPILPNLLRRAWSAVG